MSIGYVKLRWETTTRHHLKSKQMIDKAGVPISIKLRQNWRKVALCVHQDLKRFAFRWITARVVLIVMAGWIAMPATVGTGAWGDVPAKVYTYRVIHPVYGDIGTYTNIIEDRGSEISVRNRFRVAVKVLFAVAYEQKGDNKELWRDGRIVSFEGNMQKNGKKSIVSGYAEGDKFIIDAARGRTVAPGNVYPNNPWSPKILGARVLMGTGSGKLYNVKSSEGDERVININGERLKTRYFKVDGDARYELWFDESGVPVKFTDIGDDATITYRLSARTSMPVSRILKGAMVAP
jgi:hypothetical protein